MTEFKMVANPVSWVWRWFAKSKTEAKCILCAKVLVNERTTSSLIKHLSTQHGLTKETSTRKPASSSCERSTHGRTQPEEEEAPGTAERPAKKKKQLQLTSFLSRHTCRSDAIRLVCESNVSINTIVTSDVLRRLFSRSYPGDPPLPKSGTTLAKYVKEDASKVREMLRNRIDGIRSKGYKLSCSFDEATAFGCDRYLTLNIHHHEPILGNSRCAPLGLIRVESRATGEHLSEVIGKRLESVGLSRNDLLSAATDGARNVLKAVELIGAEEQRCFAHGLDLVVRKVIYGRRFLTFDPDILVQRDADQTDDEDDDTEDEDRDSDEEDSREDVQMCHDSDEDEVQTVPLGATLDRVRRIAREFKRRPNLMDEIRKITAQPEYNGKKLRPILDCKTRWYSTLLMIERTLLILPALNNVLSRHGTPINSMEKKSLEEIAKALKPFKHAILIRCDRKANLWHADKVFKLLLEELDCISSPLANFLRINVVDEIKKRRTKFSSLLNFLEDESYDFELEAVLGEARSSDTEVLDLLAKIVDADHSDFNAAEPEEETRSPSARVTWETVFSPPRIPTNVGSRMPTSNTDLLRQELELFRRSGSRGRLLNLSREMLMAIPPTSVEPERDFSILKLLLGETRAHLSPDTLDSIFILRKAFAYGIGSNVKM